jgi:uncharacterized membrane protein YedE/YeeE
VKAVSALVAGLLFGSGLVISGMTDPQRVLAFLDLFGHWNPALALTMGGAIAVAAPAFWLLRRRGITLGGDPVRLPISRRIDARLLAGSAIFGVGWGMSGICPGPGLLLLTTGAAPAIVFFLGLAAGIYAAQRWPLGAITSNSGN